MAHDQWGRIHRSAATAQLSEWARTDTEAAKALVRQPDADPEDLRWLVDHPEDIVRQWAYQHARTPPDLLRALPDSTSLPGQVYKWCVVAVAMNPAAPQDVLEALLSHRFVTVRGAATRTLRRRRTARG